jgi:hypothetical protein
MSLTFILIMAIAMAIVAKPQAGNQTAKEKKLAYNRA